MMSRVRVPVVAVILLSALAGCRKSTEKLPVDTKKYEIRGVVVNTIPQTGEVLLSHEAIPGFMGAMTMPYKLSNPEEASELHPGDHLHARLTVQEDKQGQYHNAQIDEIVVTSQAKPDYVQQSAYHVPEPGDPVPDFTLLDQSGKHIHMSQYKGKALLVTFIYTRCPLSDYCPKMSRNFAQINAALAKDKALYDKTDLLSVSFDPAYDTPAVLRSYGGAYTGQYTKETFQHWQFAAPDQATLNKMEHYFNVGVTAGDGHTAFTHSLSTVLIGPDGRIAAWYPGNDWDPNAVVAKMKEITRA